MSELRFEMGQARSVELSYSQATALIDVANARGYPSIALTQALQFELAIHQKDCIGQWVPMSEPGISGVTIGAQKWIYGIRWEEIDANLILRHQMAKSRKRMVLEFDLKLYPLVMAEIAKIPDSERHGPLVKRERSGLPWKATRFRQVWRELARAAGIPDDVKNMDSRAGATTETLEATGGNLEAARKQAGHTNIKTTQRYSRGLIESNSNVAVLRVTKRQKTGPRTP
jgi:hypothetical protein